MSTPYVTVSSGQLFQDWPEDWGTSGTLGIFCTQSFTADDGRSFVATNGGESLTGEFVTEAAITVASQVGTYAAYTIPTTDTSTPNTVRYFARIFDQWGAPRAMLFDQPRFLRASLGTSITELQWANDNAQSPFRPQADTKPTTNEMNTAINAALVNAALNQDYVVSAYASFSAAIDAMPATGASLVINQATGVTGNKTVPSYVTLKFTGKGYLTVSNGITVTVIGNVEAGRTKIFDNAFSGQGTISFAGNHKLAQVYPEWWGAVGDGATNDASAMQAALTAAGTPTNPTVVSLASCRYFLASGILPTSNTSLVGTSMYESELFFQNAGGIAIGVGLTSLSNVQVRDLAITGSGTSTLSKGLYATSCTDVRIYRVKQSGATFNPADGLLCGIGCTGSSNVRVEYCDISGNGFASGGHFFNTAVDLLCWIDGSPSGIHFSNNRIHDSSVPFSIQISNASNVFVTGNYINQNNKIGTATDASGYGINLYQTAGTPVNSHVEGNTVLNCAGIGIYVQAFNKVSIANNVIVTPAQQQTVSGSLPVAGIGINTVSYSSIVGNVIISSGQAGIWATGSFNTYGGNTIQSPVLDGIRIANAANSTISGNAIDSPGGVGIYSPVGNTAANMTITGNRINNAGSTAMSLDALTNSTVANNSVNSPVLQGIAIGGASSMNAVTGNSVTGIAASKEGLILFGSKHTIIGNNLSAASNAASLGIDTGAATENIVSGNTLSGFGTGIFDTGGTRNRFLSNSVLSCTTPWTLAASADHHGNKQSTGLSAGTSVLSGTPGTVTVATTEVLTGDVPILTVKTPGGAQGFLSIGTVTDKTSFVINSTANETSTVSWIIDH